MLKPRHSTGLDGCRAVAGDGRRHACDGRAPEKSGRCPPRPAVRVTSHYALPGTPAGGAAPGPPGRKAASPAALIAEEALNRW